MNKEYIKVTYGGETIFTIDDKILSDQFISYLITVPSKMSEVKLFSNVHKEGRKAKQFIITENSGCKLFGNAIYLMLPSSSVVNVYID